MVLDETLLSTVDDMSTENVYVFLESSNHTEDLLNVVITSVHKHSSVSFAKQLALIY